MEGGLGGQDGLAGGRWRRRGAGRGGGSDGSVSLGPCSLGVVAWGAGSGRWVLGLKLTDQRGQSGVGRRRKHLPSAPAGLFGGVVKVGA